jgi:linoleoyl-CoA desaturase
MFPAFGGLLFWKVMLANWIAGMLRDLCTAAAYFVSHGGRRAREYPAGTRACCRGEWYRMQVEANDNVQVPPLVSLLCGGADHSIEHHLFPRLPPNRLREIAPQVQRICEEHGVEYRTTGWGRGLVNLLLRLWELSFPENAGSAPILSHVARGGS